MMNGILNRRWWLNIADLKRVSVLSVLYWNDFSQGFLAVSSLFPRPFPALVLRWPCVIPLGRHRKYAGNTQRERRTNAGWTQESGQLRQPVYCFLVATQPSLSVFMNNDFGWWRLLLLGKHELAYKRLMTLTYGTVPLTFNRATLIVTSANPHGVLYF